MLSIVIITKDTKELLQQLLHSIEKDGPLKSSVKETIIIDNASADGTGDMVHNEFPWAAYVRNDKNMGFAASANQGIRQSTGEYALLLNSDTVLIEGEIIKMIAFMETHVDVGICGPQLVYPDMRPQRSSASIPSLLTEILPFLVSRSSYLAPHTSSTAPGIDNRSSIIDHRVSGHEQSAIGNRQSAISSQQTASSNQQSAIGNLKSEIISPLSALDVPSLIGAAIMIRRSLFEELSGFDEQFFFFLEETDLCLRAKQPSASGIDNRSPIIDHRVSGDLHNVEHRTLNIEPVSPPPASDSSLVPRPSYFGSPSSRVVLLPDVKVIHLQGKTVGKNWIKGRIEYNISLYKFIRKHHSALYYRSFQTMRFLKSIIVILVLSLLPFLLISKGTRRSYRYYRTLFLWHLSGCPPTAGLKDLATN